MCTPHHLPVSQSGSWPRQEKFQTLWWSVPNAGDSTDPITGAKRKKRRLSVRVSERDERRLCRKGVATAVGYLPGDKARGGPDSVFLDSVRQKPHRAALCAGRGRHRPAGRDLEPSTACKGRRKKVQVHRPRLESSEACACWGFRWSAI